MILVELAKWITLGNYVSFKLENAMYYAIAFNNRIISFYQKKTLAKKYYITYKENN